MSLNILKYIEGGTNRENQPVVPSVKPENTKIEQIMNKEERGSEIDEKYNKFIKQKESLKLMTDKKRKWKKRHEESIKEHKNYIKGQKIKKKRKKKELKEFLVEMGVNQSSMSDKIRELEGMISHRRN